MKCCTLVFSSRVSLQAKMLPFQSLQLRHTRLKRCAHTRSTALGPLHRCCSPCSGLKGAGWLAQAAATLIGPKDQVWLLNQKSDMLLLHFVESRTLLLYGSPTQIGPCIASCSGNWAAGPEGTAFCPCPPAQGEAFLCWQLLWASKEPPCIQACCHLLMPDVLPVLRIG